MAFDIEETTSLLLHKDSENFAMNINEVVQELLELDNMYNAATKEISTKLEILDDEFQARNKRNPIHRISRRVKAPQSIMEKLARKGFMLSISSAKEHLNDIAGVRVICSYIEDIYRIAEMLKSQDDIELIQETDYIRNPKPNGYRSLHMVVTVPVFFSDRVEKVKVEVQIRTIAMDFWASLEHQLKYKADGDVPNEIVDELRNCAEVIASTDMRMQNIHREVDAIVRKREENNLYSR